jgi:endoglucanase
MNPGYRGWILAVLFVPGPVFTAQVADAADGYTFKRGVNISHWLSQNFGERSYAAAWFNEDDVEWIAQQGFDHIRLPVDVRSCLTAGGTLDDVRLKPIHDAIGWSKAHGLGVVLDAHFLPGADFNAVGGDNRVYTDSALQQDVALLWHEVAARFQDEGAWLRFEILNEPTAPENKLVNRFMHNMLAAIRKSNPTRIVYVTSNKWGQFATVPDVELPKDPNVALTIHNYEPFVFTHQAASWAGSKATMPPVPFPGKVPDLTGHLRPGASTNVRPGTELTVEQVQGAFQAVADWVEQARPDLEVYVGEFGVYRADDESKKRWLGLIVSECEKRGWGWAVWDYQGGGFAVRGTDGKATVTLEALLPNEKNRRLDADN